MYRNRLCLAVFFLASALHAAEPAAPWVIAAEKFSADGIPAAYENLTQTIPLLILAEISRTSSRKISAVEQQARRVRTMSESRTKLIRERSELVLARDRILLSAEPELSKKRKTSEAEGRIRDKEAEIAASGKELGALLGETRDAPDEISRIAVWKSGTELFVRTNTSGQQQASLTSTELASGGIAALLTGTVEDIGGYLFVTARLETGVPGLPSTAVSDAAAYEDIGPLVASLSARLLPDVARRDPVSLRVTVEPESARVFIDGRLLQDNSAAVSVFAGEHTIDASAPGYAAAKRTATFENAGRFDITVTLQKEETVSVAFDTEKTGASLFLHTRYFGETPVTVTIPRLSAVGETLEGDVRTFFVFDPSRIGADGEAGMTVRTNGIPTEERIEKRRSAFYWSLGALYVSLPFSMLAYGISLNKYTAYEDGKLEKSETVINEINGWAMTAQTTRYISMALGCNVVFQLVRYLLAAEQATPRYAELTK